MLIHSLTSAPYEKIKLDECIRRGKPPPESMQQAPQLHPGLNLFYVAFLDLHTCRQLGMTMGPIDWLAIDRYCQRYDIQGEQYEDMHYFVSRLDAAYLEHHRAKSDANHKRQMDRIKQEAKRGTPRRRGK